MNIFIYDGTFEGLLCAVFDAFTLKRFPDAIYGAGDMPPLTIGEAHRVEVAPEKSGRVFAALGAKLTEEEVRSLLYAWLSELPGREMPLFRYICKALGTKCSIERDLADPDVWELTRLRRKVGKEAERFLGFARFQKNRDGIYFSAIAPKYDVIPLISGKLAERFHDQRWIVYDLTRHYGVLFTPGAGPAPGPDGGDFAEVFLDERRLDAGFLQGDDLAPGETLLEDLWRSYHAATSIKARSNSRLQRGFMPRRFWALLTEKHLPK